MTTYGKGIRLRTLKEIEASPHIEANVRGPVIDLNRAGLKTAWSSGGEDDPRSSSWILFERTLSPQERGQVAAILRRYTTKPLQFWNIPKGWYQKLGAVTEVRWGGTLAVSITQWGTTIVPVEGNV